MGMEEAQIALSCGVVFIAGDRILLVKQTKEYGGQFSIPKGRLEPSEDLRSCALRELKEETGMALRDEDLSRFPEVLHMMDREERVIKRVYYFVARVDLMEVMKRGESTRTWDTKEIESIHLLSFEQAEAKLPFSQLSVLHQISHRFSPRELLFLLRLKLITRSLDLQTGLYIYNYSARCKDKGYWNYTTLSCRGLVLDRNMNVVARPFKKFFEWQQLPYELQTYLLSCRPELSIASYEKVDGTLIILFNYQGQWILTNRRRFDLIQTHHAQILFNEQLGTSLECLDKDLTYLFESTVNYDYNVVIHDREGLVLLCAVDTARARILSPEKVKADFVQVARHVSLIFDRKPDERGTEGCVHHLNYHYMIKAKTDWYLEARRKISN